MRKQCKMIAAIGVALLLGAPALAQLGPGAVGLINYPSVQKELKLTDEQIEKSKAAVKEVFTKLNADRPGKDATPEQRAEFNKKVSDAAAKALGDALKPEQVKRLREIELQVQGLRNADAQKLLQFTDEQKSKMKEIAAKMRSGLDAGENFTELRKEAEEKEMALLTETQKKQWKELTGEPFKGTLVTPPK